jgi:HEAT repeat protein
MGISKSNFDAQQLCHAFLVGKYSLFFYQRYPIAPSGTKIGGVELEEDVRNLQDGSKPNRWRYAEALEKMGKPAVDYLIHALKDPDKWVRYVAADALGNIGDSCCVENLIEALKDGDQDVRFAVAGALGKVGIGNVRASEALTQVCDGDNCYVRIAAEEALALLNQKK